MSLIIAIEDKLLSEISISGPIAEEIWMINTIKIQIETVKKMIKTFHQNNELKNKNSLNKNIYLIEVMEYRLETAN